MWYIDRILEIRDTLYEFKRDNNYSFNLEPSWPYLFPLHYKNNIEYPNAKYPGVYVFYSKDHNLNIGKSINHVGKELDRDVKGWLLNNYVNKGVEVVLITIYVPVIEDLISNDMPYKLEQYLKKLFKPREQLR